MNSGLTDCVITRSEIVTIKIGKSPEHKELWAIKDLEEKVLEILRNEYKFCVAHGTTMPNGDVRWESKRCGRKEAHNLLVQNGYGEVAANKSLDDIQNGFTLWEFVNGKTQIS